jgi:small glutamine-rich tetratricopeptide repeat-containing protein alpha
MVAQAEQFKKVGNMHMHDNQYDKAIDAYTQAITLDPTNAVYFSNRAAAYSSKGENQPAVVDAEKAIEVDPSFIKAYSRLGLGTILCITHSFLRFNTSRLI